MKHTPGPWLIEDGNFVYRLSKDDVNTFSLCIMGGYDDNRKKTSRSEIEANAKLIAAAPRLHDALEAVIEALEDQYDGAVDSPTRWMGPFIRDGRAALEEARN